MVSPGTGTPALSRNTPRKMIAYPYRPSRLTRSAGTGRHSAVGTSHGRTLHRDDDERGVQQDDEQRVGLALDAMGRRLRSPRLPGVDVPGVDASMSPRPGVTMARAGPHPRRARSMRWADVYVCMLADGVPLRNRCPQGQADPRAAIAGGASGVMAPMAEPLPRR